MELPPARVPALPPPPPPVTLRTHRGGLFMGIALLVAAAILLSLALFGTQAWVASGSPHGAHAFLDRATDGTPYRWNPCQPIHFVVNPDDEPAGAEADIHEAIARLSAATGIRFVDDGTSVYTADQQMGSVFQAGLAGRPRYLPLLITFVTNQDFHFIVDTKQAIAFGMPYRGDGALAHEFVSGVVVIDVGQADPCRLRVAVQHGTPVDARARPRDGSRPRGSGGRDHVVADGSATRRRRSTSRRTGVQATWRACSSSAGTQVVCLPGRSRGGIVTTSLRQTSNLNEPARFR